MAKEDKIQPIEKCSMLTADCKSEIEEMTRIATDKEAFNKERTYL